MRSQHKSFSPVKSNDDNNKLLPQARLRAMEPEDLDMLYVIENDRELWGVGNTTMPYSRFALHEYMANATGDIYTDKQVRLIITNDEDDFVGIADLCDFNPQHLRAEVGIVINKKFRGLGYGLAALAQLIGYARDVLHLHQLYAIASTDNRLCINVFKRAGFKPCSELRDWVYDGAAYHNAVVMQFFCKKEAKSLAE